MVLWYVSLCAGIFYTTKNVVYVGGEFLLEGLLVPLLPRTGRVCLVLRSGLSVRMGWQVWQASVLQVRLDPSLLCGSSLRFRAPRDGIIFQSASYQRVVGKYVALRGFEIAS